MPPVIKPRMVGEDGYTTEKPKTVINDRSSLEIREAYPNFVRSTLQVYYYQTMFDQIKDNGTVIQKVDNYALGMLAVNLALIDECNNSIEEKGMNMEYQGDRKMVLKRNPALDVLKDAQAAVRFYLAQFNMTPKSRDKILGTGAPPMDSDDGFEDV